MQARARRPVNPINLDAYMLYGKSQLGDVLPAVTATVLRQVQAALNKQPSALPALVVDGRMGPKTAARLAEYQRAAGLPVTSTADTVTRARLLAVGGAGPVVTTAPGANYYVKGTPFLWLVPAPFSTGFFSINPDEDARASLQAALSAAGYNVRVIFSGGNALEVSGSQNMDRASSLDIRNQITAAAQAAGFNLGPQPVQFTVERAGSSFKVGTPGAGAAWGDKTPPIVTGLPTELGLNPFAKGAGSANLPSLSGSYSTIVIVVVVAVVLAKVLRG